MTQSIVKLGSGTGQVPALKHCIPALVAISALWRFMFACISPAAARQAGSALPAMRPGSGVGQAAQAIGERLAQSGQTLGQRVELAIHAAERSPAVAVLRTQL